MCEGSPASNNTGMNFVFIVPARVDFTVNQMPFPAHSEPLSGLLFSHNALVIGFGTDHYHEVGIPNMFVHPAWPAFWRNDDILVDCASDAVRPEAVGQL